MKKIIIILIVIALIVFGALLWIGKTQPLDNTIDNLKSEKSNLLSEQKDLILSNATINIFLAVDDFYKKYPNKIFEDDNNNINVISDYVLEIKKTEGVDIDFFVHSTNTNYVVKTKEKGGNSLYCLDTMNLESVKPVITYSVSSFKTTTNCKGVELE